jgi:hydroxymethylpyrimidine pyrophosphatase-like HAD family hydrolase
MAFGDGHNDIGLFNAVKTSVAMKNSHPSLFEHATNTTDSNLEQGVLKFLKNYFK